MVRSLRERRAPLTEDELADFELDVMAEFVFARHAAGLVDGSIRSDTSNLEQVRRWFERPLWEMEPRDADRYFGRALRDLAPATRASRAHSLISYFAFLELRYQVELHELTGRVVECPIDVMNRPRMSVDVQVRVPPTAAEIEQLFAGWREELATCRKFAPTARNYAVAQLLADVGLRINEARMLDFADVRWELGRFGKIHVRHGKGSRRRGPKQRLVPLLNKADEVLVWYIEDVLGQFDGDGDEPGMPLFPSERRTGGNGLRLGRNTVRAGLQAAVENHLPSWAGKLTPHVLRHHCASQLYELGVDIVAIQELLGHSWISTTSPEHARNTRIEDAVARGQQRAAQRWEGLIR